MEQQTTSHNYISGEQQTVYTPTSDEKTMAILAHALALVAGFLGPLIIYLIKKDESRYVAEHAKESLNFQITVFIGFIASFILMFIIIGIFLMFAVIIFSIVMVIVASVKASENKMYRYPINFRIIK